LARGIFVSGIGVLVGTSGDRGNVTVVEKGVVDVLVVAIVVDGRISTVLVTVETELEQDEIISPTTNTFTNCILISLPPWFDTRLHRKARTPVP
jgi:hypothetical protein